MDCEADTPSDAEEIHLGRDIEHPDHAQDWQCRHCGCQKGFDCMDTHTGDFSRIGPSNKYNIAQF